MAHCQIVTRLVTLTSDHPSNSCPGCSGGCFEAFHQLRKFRPMPTAGGKAMANSAKIPDARNPRAYATAPLFASATNYTVILDRQDRQVTLDVKSERQHRPGAAPVWRIRAAAAKA